MGQLVATLRSHDAEGKTDGQLLAQFLSQHDESAFAALVRRHGSMVLGVCRRVLGNAVDAEDAFQATFLVLVRKAGALKSRAVLGDWLHGVARRTALKARGASAQRWRKEQAMARPLTQPEQPRDDWLPLLDEELGGLPEKYRLPIVLCDLEGRTRQEAAKRLGWPEGTVAGRLARARAMLSRRLVRRGVVLPGAGLAAALSANVTPACVPAQVLSTTVKSASLLASGQTAAEGMISARVVQLTGEMMKTMLISKLKLAATVFVVGVLSCAGWMLYRSFGEEPSKATQGVGAEPNAKKGRLRNQEPEAGADLNANEDKFPQKEPEDKGKEPEPTAVPNSTTIAMEKAASREMIANLREQIDMKDFQNPMTLQEVAGMVYDKFAFKGKELPILINWSAFKEENEKAEDVNQARIKFPPFPRVMSTATVLEIAISQIPDGKAALLIRQSYVEITTQKRASLPYLLKERVFVGFENQALVDAVQHLAYTTGISIALDPRVEEKAKTRINATFHGDVTLAGALRILADMAELKMVDLKSGLYITTPANAKELEKELRDVEKTPESPSVTPVKKS
jgi:RNA polymerase sigma factor (sigma-70 family)